MKKIVAGSVVALFIFSGVTFAAETVKIGYVDVKKALSESNAGKGAKEALEKLIAEKRAKVDTERKKVEPLQAEYEKLSDKEKKEKQKEVQDKLQAYQKVVNEAQAEVNAKETELSKQILDDINKIVASLAKSGSYSVVFSRTDGQIMYAKEGLDLTSKVIEKMNAKK